MQLNFVRFLALLLLSLLTACGQNHGVEKTPHTIPEKHQQEVPIPEIPPPRLPQKDQYRILVFGDFGTGRGLPSDPQMQVAQGMVRACTLKGCDFALGVGDNFYPSGVKSVSDPAFQEKFEIPYRNLNFPFFMSLGNHDYEGDVASQLKYRSARWYLPAKYYDVTSLPEWLKIYAADTNALTKRQLKAIETGLCPSSDRSSPSASWKILFGHHPIYVNGGHGDNFQVKKNLLPIIRSCGVQLYLAGHDHHMESITTPLFEEVISGSAGGGLGYAYQEQRYGVTQNFVRSSLGFVVLDVTQSRLGIEFYNEGGSRIYSKELLRERH